MLQMWIGGGAKNRLPTRNRSETYETLYIHTVIEELLFLRLFNL